MDATEAQLADWRTKFGPLYSAEARGQTYIFRALTYLEYRDIVHRDIDTVTIEDEVVEAALLFPEVELDRIPAGIISSIARKIIDVSAFGNLDHALEFLNQARSHSNEVHSLMKAFIIAAIPAIKDDELDDMIFPELAKKVALAEQIIAVNQAAMGLQMEQPTQLELIDPQEQQQEEQYQDPIAQRLQQNLG